ncbi:beta-mannosidase [Winogradskyella sp.]|uniref:beta-mannosidase n=1 Tax=Winogradskyella sp. TaxID=1883156 RepID=UPI003BAB03BB
MKRLFLAIIIVTAVGCKKDDLPKSQVLNENWQFKKSADTSWYAAKVPGQVHTDLLNNQRIEDPFVANNELDLQWISEEDWVYKSKFSVDEETLKRKHLELKFNGLDTYASVFLNDSLILNSKNAFRTYQVDVKSIIKSENELKIVFESTGKHETLEAEKLPYKMPVDKRVFTRKPQFHYGWDWGPILTSSGISRAIELVSWNDLKIRDVYFKQNYLDDGSASLQAEIDIEYDMLSEPVEIEIFVNDELKSTTELSIVSNTFSVPFQIKNPKRWWPHNVGEPYLYSMKAVIKHDGRILDQVEKKKGLRTVALIQEKDNAGKTFYFKVNGVPVYAKGANYIPQHSFQGEVTKADYERLLDDTVDANMNMLRVWGGGIYEEDIFYELCDEKGIMVWQDFMFACAMYPGDTAFLENVKQEAIDNVKRLRNHSSIALWCGNNENNEAWHNWGWQTDRGQEEIDEIWESYQALFNGVLPDVVNQYHSEIDYWESSPSFGRRDPRSLTEGDAHDWWIWHDEYPFEHLLEAIPRFMSEFGFQAFPSYEAIKYINGNDSISISSKAFDTHQKHPRGYSIIRNYMERDYPIPEKDEDYVYMSQLVQANGMVLGFEAQRRARPYNMGTLYWQLNDCWPVISWSSIDYLGNWKAMHFKTKKAFEDILVSTKVDNDTLKTWIVNDKLEKQSGVLNSKIIDFNGRIIWENKQQVEVSSNTSELKLQHSLRDSTFDKNKVVLVSEFNGKTNHYYFSRPKDLALHTAEILKTIEPTEGGFKIELSSPTLQKDVFLYSSTKGRFSDNFFDILPNTTVVIEFETNHKTFEDLQIKSFNNFIR